MIPDNCQTCGAGIVYASDGPKPKYCSNCGKPIESMLDKLEGSMQKLQSASVPQRMMGGNR
jgi:ribosomal protein L34E